MQVQKQVLQNYDVPHYTGECAELLKRILSTFSKEKISSAIYSLIDAKVLCAQKNSNRLIDKRVPLTAQRLSTVLDSPAGREKANQMALADITAPNTTQKRGLANRGSYWPRFAAASQWGPQEAARGELRSVGAVMG
ncbi:hypothetical protein UY3_13576 [Chelonia mydas]|uniref:Uncharacterized protein n=1 Tax=Chelonia mydas TaxID=8469 RepID=M7BB04_CHEMY|nr:hypothetical protein UY3_13576 [Chelonia mydas]